MIKECNKEVESLKAMNISWLGWFKLPKPGQPLGHLILEFDSPNQANAAIDESLVIGSSLKTCQVYNRAYKLQQCFNCQNYGHSTSQCVKGAACCQCAGAHSSKECPGNLPKKCATCKGAHTAFDKSCRLREQEILRVVSARAETPSRYLAKMLNQTPAHSTTLENLIQTPPARGRAYTRGGRGGQGRPKNDTRQHATDTTHQNSHDTRSASRTQKRSHTSDIFEDQPTSRSSTPTPPLQPSQGNQPLFPRSANPIARKLHTMEERSKVQIHDANNSRSSTQKSSPRDISKDERENNGTPLPNDH